MNGEMASEKKQEEEGQGAAFPWGELPLEVQSSVLGWLPLRHLFRSKRVCKLWNTTISAPSFTHFPSLLPSPSNHPWLIFFTRRSFEFLLAFDFDALSWFTFDVRFLSSTRDLMHASTSAPSAQLGFAWCTGSASGLLLLDFQSSLHVCNPLTKSVSKLPSFKSIRVPITQGFSSTHIRGLFANHAVQGISTATHIDSDAANLRDNHAARTHRRSGDYTLITIGTAEADLAIEAYCADRKSWNVVGSLPLSFNISHDPMVECDGLFYSLLLSPIGILVVGESDGEGGPIWRIQAVPVPVAVPGNYYLGALRLVACQNAIFMVCGFDIWRFQQDSRDWIKMPDMPDDIVQVLRNILWSNILDCIGVGNFLCFHRPFSLQVFTYDLCNDVWSRLPQPSHVYDPVLERGLQFEPRLDYGLSI